MNLSQINKLRQEWARKGNSLCEHPDTQKERIEGHDTGDVVCTVCGAYVDLKKPTN